MLFHLRDAFRSRDIWLRHSRRYADLKRALVPVETVATTAALAVPRNPENWLADRMMRMHAGLERLANAGRLGLLLGGSVEGGILQIERSRVDPPADADELTLDLYRRLPEVRITDLLLEVDRATGFTDAFAHLRTGAPCKDRIGLLNVLVAEGINLGLAKMAEASNTHEYWELARLSRWHIESEAMNLVNAKYGNEPGIKAYTHLSDQFAPFATQTIPATVHEAPYILDGLLMNETGRRVREQYADTGGFADHVFAVTALLGYLFVPRIRDLPSKRLHVFDPGAVPKELRGLIGNKIRTASITAN